MKKLKFEEVFDKVKNYDPDYELIHYKDSKVITLKYIPTGELFNTALSKYLNGKKAPSLRSESREKTNLEKYGCVNPAQNSSVKDKIKKTNLEKYGCEQVFQSDFIKDKIKNTCLEKYNSPTWLQSDHHKKQVLDKFGVEYSSQSEEVKLKILEKRKEKGIAWNFNGKTINELSKEKHISKAQLHKLHNKGIDIVTYEKSDGTGIEQTIGSILEDLGVEFEREKYFNGKSIRVDFYIPEFNLVVEANGVYWHRVEEIGQDYHFNRREILNSLGIKVIQFNELEIIEDPIRVKYMILDMIETGGRESLVYENDCVLVNLDYSLPPHGEVLEAWIKEYEIKGHKLCNSGFLKIKVL